MKNYECEGTIHKIYAAMTFPSGFAKRTVVLESKTPDSKYTDYVAVDFCKGKSATAKDHMKDLDGWRVGDRVKVSFSITSNENPHKAGQWYTSVRGWKIERVGSAPADIPAPADPEPEAEDSEVVDDMPF